jgi:excinuclease ABC subunit C
MDALAFSHIAPSIPHEPGIYKYYNAAGKLIYVGKAKDLRKRVSSYFSKNHQNAKTIEMVSRIRHIEFTIVNNEQDAFLLENSLIKEHQPVFNINLKDDKTYPFIVIKKEPFPRIFFTRRKINDGSTYFGPYTSVGKVRELLELIKESIPLRSCKLNLSESNIRKGKFKVCLEYHLGKCLGPCEGLQTVTHYEEGIERISHFLRGNLKPIMNDLRDQMNACAENMEFEKAAIIQKRIEHLQQYQSRSLVVNAKTGTVDVFSIIEEGDKAYVNYLAIHDGCIIQTKTISLVKKLEETAAEVLTFAIARLRETFASQARELIIPFSIDYPEKDVLINIPKSGDRKKLLELSEKNVNHFREELRRQKMLHLEESTEAEKYEVLKNLQRDLTLPSIPLHIECFDNSNLQGSHPVAAMVCFLNGEPFKKDYRKFNIKTVAGIDDFASMKEIVFRRYKRLMDEKADLPDLIIIDGGKGQLNAALESLEALGLRSKVAIAGLAKQQEELFFPGDKESIRLAWNSESLKLIRRIRDEVHRFGIGFHRAKRTKASVNNELEQIKGIGKQTVQQLLTHFRSVKKIREADEASIAAVIGAAKARIITASLQG